MNFENVLYGIAILMLGLLSLPRDENQEQPSVQEAITAPIIAEEAVISEVVLDSEQMEPAPAIAVTAAETPIDAELSARN